MLTLMNVRRKQTFAWTGFRFARIHKGALSCDMMAAPALMSMNARMVNTTVRVTVLMLWERMLVSVTLEP